MVPNESELDSANAGGELAEKQHLPEATPGGVGEAWAPRPDRQTAQLVSKAGLSALQGCLEWERLKVTWVKSGSLPPQAERVVADRAPIGAMKRVMIAEQGGVGR